MRIFYCSLIVVIGVVSFTRAMKKDDVIQMLEGFGENCEPVPSKEDYEAVITNQADAGKTAKCFRVCLAKQFDMITPDKKINKEKAQGLVGMAFEGKEEETGEMIELCNGKMVEPDECDALHSFALCIMGEIKRREWPIEELE